MVKEKPLSKAPVPEILRRHLDAAPALIKGHFIPYFQPLVTLRTGQLAGFEVLARWQHPLHGTLAPSEFIAIAERDGWIGELTRQILQKAFAAAAAFPDSLNLAINVSPLQLQDTSLPEQIHALALAAGFSLSRLVIEITESALIENLESACAIVTELKSFGCGLSLDDFGTGYSSLSHLQALPFDKLKVDRSFVGSMIEKRESRKIVSAVVGLGQSLGLTTVGEGIETQEQAEMMLWLGCDFGQGYFYGRPIPAEELPACLSASREKLQITKGSAWKRISAANLDSSPTQRLAQMQAIYDGAPVGLGFIDQKLQYLNLNQKLADMHGVAVEEHLGVHVSLMIPELFPEVEPYMLRALRGEAILDVEVQVPETGETRLVSYQPALDEAGEVVGIALAVKDITKRKRTEDALRESEAHYRSMVELNPQVLWIMDPQGRNLDVSPRWDKETGLMKVQSGDHDWLNSLHPEDVQPTVRALADFRRSGSPIDVEYRVMTGESSWQWKRSRGSPRFDVSGNIVCWYGSVEDIATPTPSRELITPVGAGVDLKTTLHVADVSAGSTEQARRKQVLDEMGILDTPPEAEFDDLVVLASEICGMPISLISLVDSERQWFKAAVGLSVSETPITSSFCATAIEQQGLFVVTDATKDERFKDNPLVLGSPHIRFYAGMTLHAGDGVPIGTLCVIDTVPRALSPGQAKALAILSHQVQARLELRSRRRKQLREVSAMRELSTRLQSSDEALKEMGQRLELLSLEVEETRLQHVADESALRERAAMDTLKNEYVAMVSHELRSPLTSVRGAMGMLSAGKVEPANEQSTKLFRIAMTNLDRMIRLVNEVLDLERIASGTASQQMERCAMDEVIQQALDTMMPLAQESNVKLGVTAGTRTNAWSPTLFFNGDPDKTLQVFINLLSNAIKFSPPGSSVTVDVEASGDRLTVKFSDEGRGIPEDDLERVFDRFRQLEQDDARRLGGTGLGLAICRAIVEQHGGAIWAERNAVKGTSFFVNLPRSSPRPSGVETIAIQTLAEEALQWPPLLPATTVAGRQYS